MDFASGPHLWPVGYPVDHEVYYEGESMDVEIAASNWVDIKKIALYFNGRLIAEDYNFPYYWDQHYPDLKYLQPGTHTLKAIIYDKCGRQIERVITIFVEPTCKDLYFEDFEHLPIGPVVTNPGWFKLSHTNSGNVIPFGGNKVLKLQNYHGKESALIKLGDWYTGAYQLNWKVFLPKGSTAEFNLFSAADHAGNIHALASLLLNNPNYYDKWLNIECKVDLDQDYVQLWINGNKVLEKYILDIPLGFLAFQTPNGKHSKFFVDDIITKDYYCENSCKDLAYVSFEGYSANAEVINDPQWYKFSNTYSGKIITKGNNKVLKLDNYNHEQSALYNLDECQTGKYELSWDIFVPRNKYAECNFYSTPNANNELYKLAGITYNNSNYSDRWVTVKSIIDLDHKQIIVSIDGHEYLNTTIEDHYLGYMAFKTSAQLPCEFYIDNIIFKDLYCDPYAGGNHVGSYNKSLKGSEWAELTPVAERKSAASKPDLKIANAGTSNLAPDAQTTEVNISNAPNPFRERTTISFDLPKPMDLTIKIMNTSGQLIRQFYDRFYEGHNQIEFQANDLPAGMYILTMESNDFVATHKMLIGQ